MPELLTDEQRRERIRRTWEAMSLVARERCWHALDDDARVDAIAAAFDATEITAEEVAR